MVWFDNLTETIEKLRKLAKAGKISWAEHNEAVQVQVKLYLELGNLIVKVNAMRDAYEHRIAEVEKK